MLRETIYSNVFYIYEGEDLVGIRHDPGKYQQDYLTGDVVMVTDDGNGYICSGITTPGIGMIVGVREDDTDYFFAIQMANGEHGFCKSNRLEVLQDHPLDPATKAFFEHARNEYVCMERLHRLIA